MKQQLKHIHLFESISKANDKLGIGYNHFGQLNIRVPQRRLTDTLPEEYNQLTDEITGSLNINDFMNGYKLKHFDGFHNVTHIGEELSLQRNDSFITLSGFNKLEEVGGNLSIETNQNVKEISGFDSLKIVRKILFILQNSSVEVIPEFNKLESVWGLIINKNAELTKIHGFKNLDTSYKYISIESNTNLTEIVGFDNLKNIASDLYIQYNPKLVTISIPGTLIRSVFHEDGTIECIDRFKSPESFINYRGNINNLVEKLNPEYHGAQVGIQIWENLKEWGTQTTIDTIASRLTLEQMEIFPDEFKHLYHPDYKSTSGRDVAKLNTGQIYGIF